MSDQATERLGHYIVGRRVKLGYKQRTDFAKKLDITDRTLADIEHGVRRASAGTYAMIENALSWRPGSSAAILEGREPIETDEPPKPDQQPLIDTPLSKVPTETLAELASEALSEIRRRIHGSAPDNAQGGAWRGLNPSGHWPEDDDRAQNFRES